MNALVLVLEGAFIVSCYFQNVEGFTPWIKPQGDSSSISNRHQQTKVTLSVHLLLKFRTN